jgi:Asp-tRNA(Asn)/Glu-tRNA(Gln) amidotransferase A subunit family amidase
MMSSQNDLIYRSAKNLAEMIISRQVSSESVVAANLAQPATVNPHLNAVVNLAADTVLEQAVAILHLLDDDFDEKVPSGIEQSIAILPFIEPYDVLVSPVNAYPALRYGDITEKYPGFSTKMAYNLTGWPAVVVRAGTFATGLRPGVQTLAKPWREDVALATAAALETALGDWPTPDCTVIH